MRTVVDDLKTTIVDKHSRSIVAQKTGRTKSAQVEVIEFTSGPTTRKFDFDKRVSITCFAPVNVVLTVRDAVPPPEPLPPTSEVGRLYAEPEVLLGEDMRIRLEDFDVPLLQTEVRVTLLNMNTGETEFVDLQRIDRESFEGNISVIYSDVVVDFDGVMGAARDHVLRIIYNDPSTPIGPTTVTLDTQVITDYTDGILWIPTTIKPGGGLVIEYTDPDVAPDVQVYPAQITNITTPLTEDVLLQRISDDTFAVVHPVLAMVGDHIRVTVIDDTPNTESMTHNADTYVVEGNATPSVRVSQHNEFLTIRLHEPNLENIAAGVSVVVHNERNGLYMFFYCTFNPTTLLFEGTHSIAELAPTNRDSIRTSYSYGQQQPLENTITFISEDMFLAPAIHIAAAEEVSALPEQVIAFRCSSFFVMYTENPGSIEVFSEDAVACTVVTA